MANVRKYLQDILDAIYGEEVRGSIHDAIEAMNEESTNAEAVAISSRDSAKHSAEAAKSSETNAKASETAAKTSETHAKASETAAKSSETKAKASETAAKASETAAKTSETNSKASENAAKASENAAKASESAARTYSMQAFEYKHDAQESAEAAHEYEQQCEQIRDDIGYPIDPKGTVTFANLPSLSTAQIGWLYNVSDDFTTTSDFEEGAGKFYSAGTEVYVNSNHKWSVMAGPGVTGIKGEAESTYRKGQINITRSMLGINATNTPYANTTSGLSATNVQNAIDEIDADKMTWGANSILGAKNLIPFPYDPPYRAKQTKSLGITYTINDDGSVVANGTKNGTATSQFYFFLDNDSTQFGYHTDLFEVGKTYRLTGCPGGGDTYTYQLRLILNYNKSGEGLTTYAYTDKGQGVTFTIQSEIKYARLMIDIGAYDATYSVSDLLFKPMLRLAEDTDETFRPYAPTNKELYEMNNNLYKYNGLMGAKNLIPYPYYNGTTSTSNGVTFTANDDGSIVINGTPTDTTIDSSFALIGYYTIFAHTLNLKTTEPLLLSGSHKDKNCQVQISLSDGQTAWARSLSSSNGNERIIKPLAGYDEYNISVLRLVIPKGTTDVFDNDVVYPMLRLASDTDSTYQPYAMTNKELTDRANTTHGNYYGTCATAAATAAKVVTVNEDFKLAVGTTVTVKFTNTNTASNCTLNVNGTGAKSVWYNQAVYNLAGGIGGTANRYIKYMYDGTYWVWQGWSIDNGVLEPYQLGFGYGTCATAESTVAKVVTLANYALKNGGYVSVKFTNGVPANATMNINSRGAKPIYYQGSAIRAGIIEAGDVATFIYNGSQYVLTSIDKGTGGTVSHFYETKDDMLDDLANIGEGEIAYTEEDASDLLTRVENIEQDISDAQDDIEQINSDLTSVASRTTTIENRLTPISGEYTFPVCSFYMNGMQQNTIIATFSEATMNKYSNITCTYLNIIGQGGRTITSQERKANCIEIVCADTASLAGYFARCRFTFS